MTTSAPAPSLRVEMAAPSDDAALRRLLQRNPMGGGIQVSFEREPSAFRAAAIEGTPHTLVVARDLITGEAAGMGSRAVMDVHVGGTARRVGYLSLLRLDRVYRGRTRLLREGYALLRAQRDPGEEPYDITTVVADNQVARRLVDAGIRGLPRYDPIGRFVTRAVSARHVPSPVALPPGLRLERAASFLLPSVIECLERHNRRHALARRYTIDTLVGGEYSPGLVPEDFHVVRAGDTVVGCAALWDQRSFKQVVVQGYSRSLARLRPLLNAAAPLLGTPTLPRVGRRLEMAFASHVAVDDDAPAVFLALLRDVLIDARARGLDHVMVGFAADHPLLAVLRRSTRGREYESVVYAVSWDKEAKAPGAGRIHLEVARL